MTWDPGRGNDLGSAGYFDELNHYITACFGTGDSFQIAVDDGASWWTPCWTVNSSGRSRLSIGRTLDGARRDRLQWRIFNIMPMLATYLLNRSAPAGEVVVNLEDYGLIPGLAFCDSRHDYFLIPDPDFMGTQGYAALRHAYDIAPVAWNDRLPVVFWRGSDFGPLVNTMHDLPRVQLCQIAMDNPDLFDVGIADIRHGRFTKEISASPFMRKLVPAQHSNRYRAHIDIDGRSNAWTGLFQKLLTGSPVLKVASADGYRQWYYGALEPWVNYVPVASDLSDLVDKARWLLAHDAAAQQIGERGRALVMSLTYEREIGRAARTIAAAFRYFADPPHRHQGKKMVRVCEKLMDAIHGTNVFAGFVPVMATDLQGWNSQHEALRRAAEATNIIIDVGVWKGGSTIFLAEILKQRGIDGCVIAVDTFLGSPEHAHRQLHSNLTPRRHGMPMLYEQFLTNAVRLGVENIVVPLPQTSENAATILTSVGVKAGLVHLDAAHDCASVLRDARSYWKLLAPGGWLIGDDYGESWPGVVSAADQFSAEVAQPLEVIPPKWIIRKPL